MYILPNTHSLTHSQLQFEKGDLITVLKMVDGGWWEGVCNGKVGWFPGNYVEEFQGGTYISSCTYSVLSYIFCYVKRLKRCEPCAHGLWLCVC